MDHVTAWRRRWNEAALPQIRTLPGESTSRTWPLLGMLAIGLVTGAALGSYAMSQRSQLRRLAFHAHRMGDELADMGRVEVGKPVDVSASTLSNHRRKAASEV